MFKLHAHHKLKQERADKTFKRKDCGKKEETGLFHPVMCIKLEEEEEEEEEEKKK
jgi:hypothetical protein